jgi:hypothetical protein
MDRDREWVLWGMPEVYVHRYPAERSKHFAEPSLSFEVTDNEAASVIYDECWSTILRDIPRRLNAD